MGDCSVYKTAGGPNVCIMYLTIIVQNSHRFIVIRYQLSISPSSEDLKSGQEIFITLRVKVVNECHVDLDGMDVFTEGQDNVQRLIVNTSWRGREGGRGVKGAGELKVSKGVVSLTNCFSDVLRCTEPAPNTCCSDTTKAKNRSHKPSRPAAKLRK